MHDILFVELAAQRDLKLATFDTELLKKFPAIAQRPRSFVDMIAGRQRYE